MFTNHRNPSTHLRRVLLLDAVTCAAMGVLLVPGASLLADSLALPANVLFYAGVALFPIAAFMAVVATRPSISVTSVWLIIAGNALWVAGSLWLAFGGWVTPNAIGQAVILVQAFAVAGLAAWEHLALQRASLVGFAAAGNQ